MQSVMNDERFLFVKICLSRRVLHRPCSVSWVALNIGQSWPSSSTSSARWGARHRAKSRSARQPKQATRSSSACASLITVINVAFEQIRCHALDWHALLQTRGRESSPLQCARYCNESNGKILAAITESRQRSAANDMDARSHRPDLQTAGHSLRRLAV